MILSKKQMIKVIKLRDQIAVSEGISLKEAYAMALVIVKYKDFILKVLTGKEK